MLYEVDDILSVSARSPVIREPVSPRFSGTRYAIPRQPKFNVLSIERMIVSDLAFSEDARLLKTFKVTHILQVAHGPTLDIGPPDIPSLKILISDQSNEGPFNLAHILPHAINKMHRALSSRPDAVLLIHCIGKHNATCSCSTSLAVAYEMSGRTMPLQREPLDALRHLRRSAPSLPNPSEIFMDELYRFARETLGQEVTNPQHEHVIRSPPASPTKTSHFVNAFLPIKQ
ncbi:hypothetical protein CPC08DRAFT_715218 [Agrocybe pediades]|nr:hypothetical protein CPC08DRAFT_715218 [Agrocybe pediades]